MELFIGDRTKASSKRASNFLSPPLARHQFCPRGLRYHACHGLHRDLPIAVRASHAVWRVLARHAKKPHRRWPGALGQRLLPGYSPKWISNHTRGPVRRLFPVLFYARLGRVSFIRSPISIWPVGLEPDVPDRVGIFVCLDLPGVW